MALSLEQLRVDIARELGIESLPSDKQNELLDRMTETVMKQVFLSLADKMGDDGAEEFDTLLKGGDQKKIEEFIRQYVSDSDVFVRDIVKEFVSAVKSGGIPNEKSALQ